MTTPSTHTARPGIRVRRAAARVAVVAAVGAAGLSGPDGAAAAPPDSSFDAVAASHDGVDKTSADVAPGAAISTAGEPSSSGMHRTVHEREHRGLADTTTISTTRSESVAVPRGQWCRPAHRRHLGRRRRAGGTDRSLRRGRRCHPAGQPEWALRTRPGGAQHRPRSVTARTARLAMAAVTSTSLHRRRVSGPDLDDGRTMLASTGSQLMPRSPDRPSGATLAFNDDSPELEASSSSSCLRTATTRSPSPPSSPCRPIGPIREVVRGAASEGHYQLTMSFAFAEDIDV